MARRCNDPKPCPQLAFWAAFLSLTSAWLCALLLVARSGLGVPTIAIVASLGCSVSLAFSPFARPALAPLVLALPLSGLFLGPGALALVLFVAALSLRHAWHSLCALETRERVMLALYPACLAYFLFAQLHQGPRFAHAWMPEHMVMGIQTVDSYYHAAITSMIATHGVVSTGLDGLPRHFYHVGSHYWFAGLGRMADIEPAWSYMIGQIVVLVPAMIIGFVYALHRTLPHKIAKTPLGLLAAAILAYVALFDLNIYLFASQSLTLSLVVVAMATGILTDSVAGERASPGFASAGMAALLTFALATIKGPVAVVWIGVLAYVSFRAYSFKAATLAAFFASATAFGVAMTIFYLPSWDALSLGTAPALLRAAPDWSEAAGAAGILAVPAVACVILLLAAQGRLLHPERIVVEVVAIGCVVSMFLCTAAFMGSYFVWAFAWIATPLVIGRALLRATSLHKALVSAANWIAGSSRCIVSLGLLAVVLASLAPSREGHRVTVELPAAHAALYTVAALDRIAGGIVLEPGRPLEPDQPLKYFVASLRQNHALFGADFRDALARTPGAQALAALATAKSGAGAIAYIPPENLTFWGMGMSSLQCLAPSFFVPALTGLPLMLGLPPATTCTLKWYGVENYPVSARSHAAIDSELCDRAKGKGFTRVLVLDADPVQRVRTIVCSAPATRPSE